MTTNPFSLFFARARRRALFRRRYGPRLARAVVTLTGHALFDGAVAAVGAAVFFLVILRMPL